MKKHAELLRDPRTYMEAIGKEDDGRRRMYNVLKRDGRDTIVRVCFSVPDRNPPVRALGYFAAATRAVEEYLPEAQLQFVATVHANARINQVPLEEAKMGARLLFDAAVSIKGIAPRPETDVVYGFDAPTLPEVPMHRIIPIMRHEEVSKELAKSAARRGTRYEEYVGAHLALHDTVDVVESARTYGSAPVSEAETIVSIGAESERSGGSISLAIYVGVHSTLLLTIWWKIPLSFLQGMSTLPMLICATILKECSIPRLLHRIL